MYKVIDLRDPIDTILWITPSSVYKMDIHLSGPYTTMVISDYVRKAKRVGLWYLSVAPY